MLTLSRNRQKGNDDVLGAAQHDLSQQRRNLASRSAQGVIPIGKLVRDVQADHAFVLERGGEMRGQFASVHISITKMMSPKRSGQA